MVGNVLTEGKVAVGMYRIHYDDIAVLGSQFVGALNEALGILFCPPVCHITVLVILSALVVESVCHFMTYHNAYGTIVHSIVGIGIEEGRLQYTGREAYLVGRGVVVGIYRLGGHEPLVLIDRLAFIGELIAVFELAGAQYVDQIRLFGINFQTVVIAPLVGITYLYMESGKFLMSLCLGSIAHPFERVDVLGKRFL